MKIIWKKKVLSEYNVPLKFKRVLYEKKLIASLEGSFDEMKKMDLQNFSSPKEIEINTISDKKESDINQQVDETIKPTKNSTKEKEVKNTRVRSSKLMLDRVDLQTLQNRNEKLYSQESFSKIYNQMSVIKGENVIKQSKRKKSAKVKFRKLFGDFLLCLVKEEIKNAKSTGSLDINKVHIFFPRSSKYDKSKGYGNWIYNWNLVQEIFFIFMGKKKLH